MTRRGVAGLLAVAIGPLGWCFSITAVVGGDPMLALEIVGTAVAVVWAMLVARELVRSYRTSQMLAAAAQPAELFGVAIRVTHVLRTDAVVVGAIRPRIFVGSELLETLSDDEIRAVLLHEDHHRRTRAPLRAAALGAWLRLFGRSTRLRAVILDRLTDLETLADADAIRRGSSPRSLARALLKGDVSPRPVSFAYAADRRVEQLLERAAGHAVEPTGRLPYEWLPVIVLAIATVGCHTGL
jgi:hypothetical protein